MVERLWTDWPGDGSGFWMNCQTTGCLEADFAFDPERNMVYAGLYNLPESGIIRPIKPWFFHIGSIGWII